MIINDTEQILGKEFVAADYAIQKAYTTSEPPRVAALKVMQEHGLKPPAAFPVGQIFRFPDETDKVGKLSGWAVYYEYCCESDIIGICIFGSFHDRPPKTIWCSKRPDYMTTTERNEFTSRTEAARIASEDLREKTQIKAAEECREFLNKLSNLRQNSYTQRKKIKPYKAFQSGDAAVIPMHFKGEICSLQYIAADGSKKFHPGGRVAGAYLKIEGKGESVYICEGYSTGCSIHEATGETVYIAFSAGNLYEVCSMVQQAERGRIVICADDDWEGEKNTGVEAAMRCANVYGFEVITPVFTKKPRGTDFNDMAAADGLDAVKKRLEPKPKPPQEALLTQGAEESRQRIPAGVISDIYNYYMATSGNYQPGYALQTAIAIVSSMCGRYFITDQDNTTTLYLLNVGKSATGKEHCKKTIEKIFYACGLQDRIAGDGFTSGAAVLSLLLRSPCALTVIDEFGRYLEAAATAKGSLQKEANTSLMESISRPDGILRPKTYSTMTLTKDHADALSKDRYVVCPSLTLLGLTVPNTFFEQIKLASVLDGFLNRFIVYVSENGRELRKRTNMFDVPQSILQWSKDIRTIITRLNPLEVSNEYPNRTLVSFSEQAVEIQQSFEREMLDLQNSLEAEKLDALPGRSNEWAMRLSLCVALSRNPYTDKITGDDMQWSVDYIRKATLTLLAQVKENVSENKTDGAKKEILSAIRFVKKISWKEMQMATPFSKYSNKELKDYLQSLVDAELISTTNESTGRGRPTLVYTSIE